MRYALFCDGAYSMTVAATDAVHVLETNAEAEDVREVVVRRRTPIVAAVTVVVERRPVTVARSRKEDAVAIRPSYLVAFNAVLRGPFPSAVFL